MSIYPYIQNVPQVSVNEEEASITVWIVDEGEFVKKGQEIAEVETTKAVVEVSSEADGYLFHLFEMGDKVKIGYPFAVISEDDDPGIKDKIKPQLETKDKDSIDVSDKKYTKKAAILAKKHSLNIDDIPATGILQEADVMRFIKKGGIRKDEVVDLVEDEYRGTLEQRIIMLGGGRGAVQVLDAVMRSGRQKVIGILDDNEKMQGKKIFGYEIIGALARIHELWEKKAFDAAVITFSNNLERRAALYEELSAKDIPFANVIDPSVQIHSNVELGSGNVIIANCRIGSCAEIGNNNFLSAYVNIEHHNILGNHCTFGPGVLTSSRAQIGDKVKFGTGIFIEPGVKIGSESIISSGSILTVDVPERSIVKQKFNFSVQERK